MDRHSNPQQESLTGDIPVQPDDGRREHVTLGSRSNRTREKGEMASETVIPTSQAEKLGRGCRTRTANPKYQK